MHRYNVYFNNKMDMDLGTCVIARPNIPIPEKNIVEKEIKGKNGTIQRDYKTYKNIEIPIQFNFVNKKDFNGNCRDIKAWLNNITDDKLYFSDDVDYFYKVKRVVCKDIARELKVLGTFTASFICEPFQYDINAEDEIILTNNFILENPYFIEATPIIKILGEGIINLNVNGNILTANVGQDIIINSNLELAYRYVGGVLNYQNTKLKGDYPFLIEGQNNISWTLNTGTRLDKITIQPNFKTI